MSLFVALSAGVLSFASPCVFPLLPGYLAVIGGLTASQVKQGKFDKWQLFLRLLVFVAGLILPLVLLGLSASMIGQWLASYQTFFTQFLGLVIILFGFQLMGLLKFQFLHREYRLEKWFQGNKSYWGIGLMGLAFGFGWTPCIGPILSSILVLAGNSETMGQGGLLLLFYGLGLGLPFLAVGLLGTYFLSFMGRIKKYIRVVSIVSGMFLLVIGCLLIFGKLQLLNLW